MHQGATGAVRLSCVASLQVCLQNGKALVTRLILGVSGVVWVASLAAGISVLGSYANTSGTVAHAAPAEWPSSSRLTRAPGHPTLVMVLHPHCPCAKAIIGELAVLLARTPPMKTTHVLFHRPAGVAHDWHRTPLWSEAVAIPGVTVSVDQHGVEARRFGVATSGHTLLYDGQGRLQFSGGITASRGHAGDNVGRASLVALLQQRPAARQVTSVFGCSLIEPPTAAGAVVQ